MVLRHTAFNLAGLGIPLLVALGCIPPLIAALGVERFGLLTLIWAVVSYFGLFDLGLGRALTQQLAVVFADKSDSRAGPIAATATLFLVSLGVLGGLLMAAAAPWGVGLIEAVPDHGETVRAVYAMAFAMPFIVLTSGFRGILEAQRAFGVINLIRLPMGLFTFLGPLAVVVFAEPRLDWITWVLAGGRVVGCAAHAYYAWRLLPSGTLFVPRSELVKPLCVSGGWLTVSNIVSPFMGYVDRFVIGAIISAGAVAYYATPHELVTKLWIIPGALTAVLYPTFSAQMARRDEQTWSLFSNAIHWLFVALLPITLALALFAHELLNVWIGPEFADHSAVLLQIFAAGILVNCLAHVPFTLIQSAGAPRLGALAHLAELPLFLAALWWLTSTYGVVGAAGAWLLRMVVDTVLMFGLACPFLGRSLPGAITARLVSLGLLAAAGFAGSLFQTPGVRIAWLIAITIVVALTLYWPRRQTQAMTASGHPYPTK